MPYLPPLNLIRKKMNSWHLTSRLTARSFSVSESTASRVRSGRCPRQCATFLHGQMYLQNACFAIWPHVGTKFFNSSHHFLSMDGWPGDAIFFLWGRSAFEDHPQEFGPKKVPAPWILFLTPAPRPLQVTFFWLVKLNICGCTPFAKGQMYFQKKNACFAIWARWHKILEFVPPCPICGWLAWRCDFFPVGQPLKIIPQVFSQKKVQPLGFYFWHLRLGLFKSLFWLVKLNMYVCTLLQGQMHFQQKTYVL